MSGPDASPESWSAQKRPELTGMSFGDGYIILDCIDVDGVPDTFTFGVLSDFFTYTMTSIGSGRVRDEAGRFPFFISYKDEVGKDYMHTFVVAADKINELNSDVDTYIHAIGWLDDPKSDA